MKETESGRQPRGHRPRVIALATVGVLLILLALSWALVSWREEQLAARLTPELVLQAFQDANYQVNDVRVVQGRGNIEELFGSCERFIEFEARAGNQSDFSLVRVLQYGSKEEAEKRAGYTNGLNERMNGGYYYAYRRGAILMAVRAYCDDRITPSDKIACWARTASEFNGVFRSATER